MGVPFQLPYTGNPQMIAMGIQAWSDCLFASHQTLDCLAQFYCLKGPGSAYNTARKFSKRNSSRRYVLNGGKPHETET